MNTITVVSGGPKLLAAAVIDRGVQDYRSLDTGRALEALVWLLFYSERWFGYLDLNRDLIVEEILKNAS